VGLQTGDPVNVGPAGPALPGPVTGSSFDSSDGLRIRLNQ
jgi:hypothetical protein